MHQTLRPSFARALLAVGLVCALLVTQFGLSRHVVEHGIAPVVTAALADDTSDSPDHGGCLTCLEHQAHGAVLISQATTLDTQNVHVFERQALAPNNPYLAPGRASQRAPPRSS